VYDLAGRVRFEAWHDGFIESAYWLAEPGVLVCAGVNSEVFWRGRGNEGSKAFPIVAFALRPRDGERAGWISTTSRPGTCKPLWYKCLLPVEAADNFRVSIDTAGVGVGAPLGEDYVRYAVMTMRATGGRFLTMLIDAEGNIIRRAPSDEYGQGAGTSGGLPDPEVMKLGDLPPIVPGGEAFRPANN
jgi:hypothetical protein